MVSGSVYTTNGLLEHSAQGNIGIAEDAQRLVHTYKLPESGVVFCTTGIPLKTVLVNSSRFLL